MDNGGKDLMEERPLTVQEAADFLSVKVLKVRQYINQGQLKAYKLGNGTNKKGSRRRWRIWKHDLVEFVNRSGNIREE